MYDIEAKETIWNKRIKECMGNSSQKAVAADMNKRYHQSVTQTTISRWCNVGSIIVTSNGSKKKIGFPSYENMIMIADYFNVSLSYLTGEIDCINYNYNQAVEFTGLTQDTIKGLQSVILPRHRFSHSHAWRINFSAAKLIEKLVTSDFFITLLENINSLDEIYVKKDSSQNEINKIKKKWGKKKFDEAVLHMDDGPLFDTPSPFFTYEELAPVVREIEELNNSLYGEDQQRQYDTDVFKYRIMTTFSKMIDTLYK